MNEEKMPIEVGDLALFLEGEYAGWIMWRRSDGQWVTAKRANPYDLMAFETIRILRIECARDRNEFFRTTTTTNKGEDTDGHKTN